MRLRVWGVDLYDVVGGGGGGGGGGGHGARGLLGEAVPLRARGRLQRQLQQHGLARQQRRRAAARQRPSADTSTSHFAYYTGSHVSSHFSGKIFDMLKHLQSVFSHMS